MTVKNIIAHIAGLLFIAAGFGWLYLDVRPDGHIELATAAGVALLMLAGGFLVDKAVTIELLAFVKTQAQGAIGLWRNDPPGGAA